MEMRTLIDLVETTSPTMVRVYHVTQKRYVPSIMKQGLIPKIGKLSRSANERKPAIYVFPDVVSMEDGITNWLGDEIPYVCSVLELTIPKDWLTQHSVRWEATIEQTVPPSHIKVVVDDIDEWNGQLENPVLPADD